MTIEEALTGDYYIDYTMKEINYITSVILGEIGEQGKLSTKELMNAKKVLNTVFYTLVSEKEWCDEVVEVVSENEEQIKEAIEKEALEDEVWNSLPS